MLLVIKGLFSARQFLCFNMMAWPDSNEKPLMPIASFSPIREHRLYGQNYHERDKKPDVMFHET